MPSATISYGVSAPPTSGQITITYSGQGGPGRLELTGAQTYPIDLAMMPSAGLRGLLVVRGQRRRFHAPHARLD